MNSTERRKKLLAWLETEETLSLGEMIERFGVSKMTIHRDLDLLERRQALKRIHGGAARLGRSITEPAVLHPDRSALESCLICFRSPSQQLLYTLTLQNGEQKVACCPHCGVSAHLMFGNQVTMAMTADFLSGGMHSAQHSFFVMGSVATPCCKPSLLTFDDEEMAKRFKAGFGGEIGRLQEAMNYLEKDISIHAAEGCPHCASGSSGGTL